MQESAHDNPVVLGFGSHYETEDLYRLRSHYLPLGKIGGKPAWLNPKNLPPIEQLECKLCKRVMCFTLQVYATANDDPVHSFHRTLFFFVCRNPECSKPNDPSNMVVFRCGLPRENPYYSKDGPMDPDEEGDVPDPRYPADAPHLCKICGCEAKKRCAKCGEAWYCCRDHQAIDWGTGHKAACGQPKDAEGPVQNPPNFFLFKEQGMEMDQEYVTGNLFDDISDDDDDEEVDQQEQLEQLNKLVQKMKENQVGELGTADDVDKDVEEDVKDTDFIRFHRLLALAPDQVLRYKRGGVPLPTTLKAPKLTKPPPCDLCKGPRQFEMQITPHLLSLMGVDGVGQSIDWASVFVYTCKNSCEIPDSGYAREHLVKQDFVQ